MVERMRRKGDNDGADAWLRIIVAIGELRDDRGEALTRSIRTQWDGWLGGV